MLTGFAELRTYFRGDQPYWRAYSLFAVHLAIVLVASWGFIEWSPRPADGDREITLRPIALLLLSLGPTLWILWACARNVASTAARWLARAGVIGGAAVLTFLVEFFWGG